MGLRPGNALRPSHGGLTQHFTVWMMTIEGSVSMSSMSAILTEAPCAMSSRETVTWIF